MSRNYGIERYPLALQRELKIKRRRWCDFAIEGALLTVFIMLVLFVFLFFAASSVRADEIPESAKPWIPLHCCWTTGACAEVQDGELRKLPGDGM